MELSDSLGLSAPQSPEVDVIGSTPVPAKSSASTTSSDDQQKRYFCQRCLNHRLEFPRKGHKPYCRFASCRCEDCEMVEKRRQLNNQLSKRRLDPNAPKSEPGQRKIRDPKCARCSAHGEETALRGHKRASCPFNNCDCHLCQLVENRRSLMARQIKLRRDQQKARRAQLALEETEDDVRRSMGANLDLTAPPSAERVDSEAAEEIPPAPAAPKRKRKTPPTSVAAPTVVSPFDFLEQQLKNQSLPLFSAFSFFPPIAPPIAPPVGALPTPPASAWPTAAPLFPPVNSAEIASFASFGVDWLAMQQSAALPPAPVHNNAPPLRMPPLLLPPTVTMPSPPTTQIGATEFVPASIGNLESQHVRLPTQSSGPLPNETVLLAAQMLSGQYGSDLQRLLGQALQVTSILEPKVANTNDSPQNPLGPLFSFQ